MLIEHLYDCKVLEVLASAVEELELPVDGDALIDAIAVADRLAARIAVALGEFDAADLHVLDGSLSSTSWLAHATGMSWSDARRQVRTARRLHALPVTRQAWLDGVVSGGQVDAVVANVKDGAVDLFVEHESEVIPSIVGLSVRDTVAAMRHWALCAEAVLDPPPPAEPKNALFLDRTLDERGRLSACLDAEATGILEAAIRLASSPDAPGEPIRSAAERRAHALTDVCRWFLDHQEGHQGGRHRPHLNVVIDLEALEERGQGRLVDGPLLDPATIERLLCDAGVHRVVTRGPSAILDFGMTTRTISASLWSALVLRDVHCRAPGCDRPATWCEAHHVRHWVHHGTTELPNLVLACSRHHHLWHQPGWHVKLLPDAVVEVTTPEGRVLTGDPPIRR